MYISSWKILLLLPLLSGIIPTLAQDAITDEPTDGDYDDRLLDGKPVNPPHSRPYVVQVVSISQSGNKQIIAGTIYAKWTITTTGVFLEQYSKIYAGKYYRDTYEDSQQERKVCWHTKHPDQGGNGNIILYYDYGLLHLSEPLIFNENVQPANFTPVGDKIDNYGCYLTGWGGLRSGTNPTLPKELRETHVTIQLPGPGHCKYHHPTSRCLEKGACWFDWGDPIICSGLAQNPKVVAYTTAVDSNCGYTGLTSMAALPVEWVNRMRKEAENICGRL